MIRGAVVGTAPTFSDRASRIDRDAALVRQAHARVPHTERFHAPIYDWISRRHMEPRPLVPKLGVGLAFQTALRPFIEREIDRFDFLEVVPDILWTDLGPDAPERYVDDPAGVGFLGAVRERMPVIPHGIGMSIGSAHRFDLAHLEHIARWHDWLRFPWHSDHLAFNFAEHADGEMNVGVTLPLPYDQATIDMLAPRIARVRERVPVPFLLENNVYFVTFPGEDYDEATFLNRLCESTGCGLLLDLHNVYCNCRNNGGDPRAFLDRLDLDNVVEIHIAGGLEHDGFYLDGHCGPTPPEVWDLVERVLPGCRNLGGIVFEILGSWVGEMGSERLIAELGMMREAWGRHQPAPVAEAV
jgi:uncharacterized protein (UPF0276 family)